MIPRAQAPRFFEEYHTLLKSQGIDGVKVDNQAVLEGLLPPGETRSEMYAAYRGALEQSANKHFGGNLLHCMSCVNDLLYARGETALTRTSTDFWPNKPETHGLHLWTNALVSLWFGRFAHPDWDMFQTHLEGGWSAFHAAARAISGGPVYVSDVPGKSDAGLLNRLVCDDGMVPRCDGPAMMAQECLFADLTRGEALLKLVNTNRSGRAGVVGLFHCGYHAHGAGAMAGAISPGDVAAIGGHDRYLVCVMHDGIMALPRVMRGDEHLRVVLNQSGHAIATIVPLVEGLAVAGLMDKMNPGATVGEIVREGKLMRMSVRGTGRLGLWCEGGIASISQNRRITGPAEGPWIEAAVQAGEVVIKLA
jgi:raffinose synthase